MSKNVVEIVFQAKVAAFSMMSEEVFFILDKEKIVVQFDDWNGSILEYYFDTGLLLFKGDDGNAPLWIADKHQKNQLAEYKYKTWQKNDAKAAFEKLKELALAS